MIPFELNHCGNSIGISISAITERMLNLEIHPQSLPLRREVARHSRDGGRDTPKVIFLSLSRLCRQLPHQREPKRALSFLLRRRVLFGNQDKK